MRPPRPCITCGTPTTGTRCTTCEQQHQRQRNHRRTWYHGDWERKSRETRAAWIAEHGMTCPGYQRDPHPATNLELDHTTGQVLCHACNVAAGPAGH